jgi:hypothetical protein
MSFNFKNHLQQVFITEIENCGGVTQHLIERITRDVSETRPPYVQVTQKPFHNFYSSYKKYLIFQNP